MVTNYTLYATQYHKNFKTNLDIKEITTMIIKPKVSIIIPIYNVAPYLRRCLNSVVNQTLREIEIICINDGSTDSSLEILTEYAELDERIKIINFNKNKGVSVARNKALAEARGEYIGFVDGDDSVDIDFFERLYTVAHNEQVDIAKAKERKISTDGESTTSELNELITKIGARVFSAEFVTAIYRNSLLKKHNILFPENITNAEDNVFLTKVMLKTNNIKCIDDTYYYYHRRDNSAHSEFLTIEKINAVSHAMHLMINEINNAYEEQRITDEEYDSLFETRLFLAASFFDRNKTDSSRRKCAELMIDMYNKCVRLDALNDKLEINYPLLYDPLYKNDADDLIKFYLVHNTLNKFVMANLRERVLRSAKKNLKARGEKIE